MHGDLLLTSLLNRMSIADKPEDKVNGTLVIYNALAEWTKWKYIVNRIIVMWYSA